MTATRARGLCMRPHELHPARIFGLQSGLGWARSYTMELLSFSTRRIALGLAVLLAGLQSAVAADHEREPCTEDAMIVFDASGSMAGNMDQGIATIIPRIDEVRSALAKVLPSVARNRRVGLITYGPGPYQQCNVDLNLKPTANAAPIIMKDVDALTPAGKTPLTQAVKDAAEVLDFRTKPGVIVVVTDGEETCGGAPCELGNKLHAEADQLTIHIIGFRMKDYSWTGEQSVLDAKCLAERNNGLYISAENRDELVKAFQKTLGCPMMSELTPPN
jgi:Ca-activated chloride channel family protein